MVVLVTAVPLTVLYVEDSREDAELLARGLQKCIGVTLEIVRTLAEAIDWFGAHTADVVLLDLGLPDSRGGLDALDTIRAVAPEIVPIVVYTGREENARSAMRRGATAWLDKGSSPTVVCQQLRLCVVEALLRAVRLRRG